MERSLSCRPSTNACRRSTAPRSARQPPCRVPGWIPGPVGRAGARGLVVAGTEGSGTGEVVTLAGTAGDAAVILGAAVRLQVIGAASGARARCRVAICRAGRRTGAPETGTAPGPRAVTVHGLSPSGVAGVVRPCARVDVLWTGRRSGEGRTVARPLATGLRAFAVEPDGASDCTDGRMMARQIAVQADGMMALALIQRRRTGRIHVSLAGTHDVGCRRSR